MSYEGSLRNPFEDVKSDKYKAKKPLPDSKRLPQVEFAFNTGSSRRKMKPLPDSQRLPRNEM